MHVWRWSDEHLLFWTGQFVEAFAMRIHYLQHVPFEDLANIESWACSRGHIVSRTLLFANESFPDMSSFDWLVIMGGPMNIYEHDKYPWLIREREFIGRAIAAGKIVLGICLGAQLMSDVLGGEVTKNKYREIGWFPVSLTCDGQASPIFSVLPERFMALHWHGDTFSIPPGAQRMAESDACFSQAFVLGKAIGLQFHLESSKDSIDHLLENCADELTGGPYVQRPEQLANSSDNLDSIHCLMKAFLDKIEEELGH
jgi:GMP synthase-like glutamine amidotransferase